MDQVSAGTCLLEHVCWNLCAGTYVLDHVCGNVCDGSQHESLFYRSGKNRRGVQAGIAEKKISILERALEFHPGSDRLLMALLDAVSVLSATQAWVVMFLCIRSNGVFLILAGCRVDAAACALPRKI